MLWRLVCDLTPRTWYITVRQEWTDHDIKRDYNVSVNRTTYFYIGLGKLLESKIFSSLPVEHIQNISYTERAFI